MCTGDARSFVYSIFKSSEETQVILKRGKVDIFKREKERTCDAMRCFSNEHQECVCGTLHRVAAAVGLGERHAGWRTLMHYWSLGIS